MSDVYPIDVSVEIRINCRRGVVAAYAADPSNAPKWYVNIVAADWESSRPLALGSRVAFEARFLGLRMRYTYEVATYDPERLLVMHTTQGRSLMETTYTWSDAPHGATTMTLRNRGGLPLLGRPFAPFIAAAMRRATTKDLARLKFLLEPSCRDPNVEGHPAGAD